MRSSPFARVASSTDAVHGDGEGLVGLTADTPKRHGAGAKAFYDLRRGFHFFERDGSAFLKFQQAAQRSQGAIPIVDLGGELLVGLRVVLAGGMLQRGDGVRIPLVEFAPATPLIVAA